MDFSQYTKDELMELADWYDVKLFKSMSKKKMVKLLEDVVKIPVMGEPEEIQMSVRVRRIKESNNGT